ncbi:MAG: AMP-binding protein [Acidobacteriota bacterium]
MIKESLQGKTLLITGATGFLGQPLVEKILWSVPDVRRIYVLIRPKRHFGGGHISAQERLEKELYRSSVFDRLQMRHQGGFEDFLREKLQAVPGDIARDNLGLDEDLAERLRQEVDIVINSAAVVSFDAPLDQSLELNVFGARRVAVFAASCRSALLVHVSTAYSCGAATGTVLETVRREVPGTQKDDEFPLRAFSDPQADIREIQRLIARICQEAEAPELRRRFAQAFLKRKSKGRRRIRRASEIANLRRKWLETRLAEEGKRWARERGWNDTYTYTKALGEQMVLRHRGDMPTAIVRRSVIERCLYEPSPGLLDGLRMADPLIVAIGKGRLRSLPLNPDVSLDLVPVDMVVNALLAMIPRVSESRNVEVIQVATSSRNPITLGQLYELIYQYFRRNPMLDREGRPIHLKRLRFPSPTTFRLQHHLRAVPLRTAERTLERLPTFDATQRAKRRVSATKAANQKLYYYGELYEPYLNLDCAFSVDRALELYAILEPEERAEFDFDVTRLNWRHYIQNVHIPGVKKYILKMEGVGSLELSELPLGADFPKTIPELIRRSARRLPDHVGLQVKRKDKWVRYTYAEIASAAEEIAGRLHALDLQQGDRVILFSENQPEWGIAFFGASMLGLIVVPLDSQTWHREVWSVAEFTEAKALLVSEKCLRRLTAEELDHNEARPQPQFLLNVNRLCKPFDLPDHPRSSGAKLASEPVPLEFPELDPDGPASIIFTTGTAVDPKGAVLSHRSFLNNLRGVNHYLSVSTRDRLLSVLPLYHALEFSCGFLMAVHRGATVTYVQSLKPRVILETMRETRTTCMLGVPTLFALIREDVERRILKVSKSALKGNLLRTSKRLSQSVEETFGRNIGRRLFGKVYREFGGHVRVFVSGGSSLGRGLYRDFKAMGLPIYEGYGLTETAPVLTVNPLHRSREGSAGKPLPGVELRLFRPDQDGVGEIIVRSPSLMCGYYQNQPATEAVLRDGWFHTGDLGWVDADGYVYITGRCKDVIVTGAGKNVYPSDLEAIYRTLPSIREICVLGMKSGLTEDVHAVIVPEDTETSDETELKKAIQKEIQEISKELPSYQRLQQVHIWKEALPTNGDGGLDRPAIRDWVQEQLEGPTEESPRAARGVVNRRETLYGELSRLSGIEIDEITEEANLYTDLGLDSLMAVELLLSIERNFGVTVPDEHIATFQTVGDVLAELRRRGLESRNSTSLRRRGFRSGLSYGDRPMVDRAVMRASFAALRELFTRYFQLTVSNATAVPKSGSYLIAANHSSHLDSGAVISALSLAMGIKNAQRMHVIGARDYFFNSSLKGWIFSTCLNVVPIERDEIGLSGLRMVGSILSQGEPVLIFPEGTRSRSGKLQEFKPGVGLIAWEYQTPIVPTAMYGISLAANPEFSSDG